MDSQNVVLPCSDFLSHVDSARLDCVTDDYALLLAYAGVPDGGSALAEEWCFTLRPPTGRFPAVALPSPGLDARLERRTGYAPDWHISETFTDALRQWRHRLRQNRPVLVVADAYRLPWLPYHGHEHMEHGFVLSGVTGAEPLLHIVDPYENATEWGTARPSSTTVAAAELAGALGGVRWATMERRGPGEPGDPARIVPANAAAILAAVDGGGYGEFVDGHGDIDAATLGHLALQTWLLARDRALHGAWLACHRQALAGLGLGGLPEEFAAQVAAAWHRAETTAYLSLRRARRGRPVAATAAGAVRDAAAAEARVAASIAERVTEMA